MSPFFIPMILPNMAAANVSRLYGLKGYTSTVITACAAGTQGIGEAAVAIQRGVADVVLGGGCEAGISHLGLGGFNVIKALSRRNEQPEKASRPFDAKRDGFVPSEGAAILVMESLEHALDRGADILAEVTGYGVFLGCVPRRPAGTKTDRAPRALCGGRSKTRDWSQPTSAISTRTAHQPPRTTSSRPSPSRRSSEIAPTMSR